MLTCQFAPPGFHDATTSFAILTCASLILGVIFIPKLHTIIQRGGRGSNKSGNSTLYRSNSSSSIYSGQERLNPFYGGRSHQHQHLTSKQKKKLGKMAQYGGAGYPPPGYYRGGVYSTGGKGEPWYSNQRVVHTNQGGGPGAVRFQGLGTTFRRGHPSYEEWLVKRITPKEKKKFFFTSRFLFKVEHFQPKNWA